MKPANILIVDDEDAICRLLQKILRKSGYVCFAAANAAEARARLARDKIDLILCDIRMPGESGIELIRWVKREYPHLAIIMVSGIDDPEEAQAALEVGVYGYIIKPFEKNQMLIGISNALRRRELELQEQAYRNNLEAQVQEKTRDLEMVVEILKESEAQFRSLAEGSIQGILIHRELKPLFANQALARLHGYTLGEILRLDSILQLIAPQDRDRLLEYREARLQGKLAPTHYEYQGVRKDGSLLWLESRVAMVQFDGAPAIQLTVADITGRKEGEAALRESEELFRAISESARDAIIMVDQEGGISYWNKAAETLFGFSSAEALGKNLYRLIVPEHLIPAYQNGLEQFKNAGRGSASGRTLEMMALRRGGEEFPVEVSLSAVQLQDCWRSVGIIRDISKRQPAEKAFGRVQRQRETLLSGNSAS